MSAFTNHSPSLKLAPPADHPQQAISAWSVSLVVHAIALVGAVTLIRDLPPIPAPAYRLEFLLNDDQPIGAASSTQTSAATADHSETPTRTISPKTAPSSVRPPVPEPITPPSRVEHTPTPVTRVVQQIERMTTDAPSVNHPSPIMTAQPVEQRLETIPTASSSGATELITTQVSERPLITTASKDSATDAVEQAIAARVRQSMPAHSSESDEALSSSHHDGTAAPQPATEAPASASGQAVQASSQTLPPHPEGSESPAGPPSSLVMNHPPISRTIPARSDFGWLNDLLKRRIESLQAYPRLARMQGWEGSVVVKATIRQDGQLLDAVVLTSSGYAALDQDALQLMHRACPIHLPQDLGQSHIEVVVPVHYRLE